MKKWQFLYALISVFLFIAAYGTGTVSADTDQTLSVSPDIETGDTSINPENNIEAVGILDNFNRPDGPIGANWTNQAGTFNVVNNAVQGGFLALATYNGATSTIVEGDVEVNGTSLQYTGLVLAYADISNSLFLKVQGSGGTFTNAACYIGNNGSGGNFGLGYFTLDSPFATAHMQAALSGSTVTITFSNIDGGPGMQTYSCTGAPVTGGNGIGIAGYNNIARMDNFAADVPPAWNNCLKDVSYLTEYQFNIEAGNVIRGQAFYPSPNFPAPLTGYFNPVRNTYSFTIGYLSDNSRHYWVNVSTLAGYTWGILGPDSSFYDGPRAAQLVSCGVSLLQDGEGETGDSE